MLTRQLSHAAMTDRLQRDGVIRERPDLARYILEAGIPYSCADVQYTTRTERTADPGPPRREAPEPAPAVVTEGSRAIAEAACRAAGIGIPAIRWERPEPAERQGAEDASRTIAEEAMRVASTVQHGAPSEDASGDASGDIAATALRRVGL